MFKTGKNRETGSVGILQFCHGSSGMHLAEYFWIIGSKGGSFVKYLSFITHYSLAPFSYPLFVTGGGSTYDNTDNR